MSFNHVVLSFRAHRIPEVSNTRMKVMKKRLRKHRRRREVNLACFNSFHFYLLSSTTDLAHKLEDAKNEIRGMPFTFYFTVLLSSSTLGLKKELSEGFHKFLNTKPPTGMCFFLCSLHFSLEYVVKHEPLESRCLLQVAQSFYLDIFKSISPVGLASKANITSSANDAFNALCSWPLAQ